MAKSPDRSDLDPPRRKPGGGPVVGPHPDRDLPEPDRPNRPDRPDPREIDEPDPEPDSEPEPEPPPPPVVSGLVPPSASVGDPSFSLRVLGAGFDLASIIVVAGNDEPTTYFSEGELSTGWNMPLWQGADPAIPVLVRNADGQESNTVGFVLDPPRAVPLDPAEPSKPSPAVDQIQMH